MEYKVRMESQTLVEKIFRTYERRGVVRAYQVASMLKAINPELEYGQEELQSQIVENELAPGTLDLESFNRIAVNFLIRQTKRESDFFSHKNDISLNDFSLP